MAASLAISGTSKSGRPIEKLIGSFILAARSKTLRMPEASTAWARWEVKSRMKPEAASQKPEEMRDWRASLTAAGRERPFSYFFLAAGAAAFAGAAPFAAGAAPFAAGAAPLAAGAAPLAPAAGAAPA